MTSSQRDACSSFSRSTSAAAYSAPFSVASPSRPNCRTRDSSFSFTVASRIYSASPRDFTHSCFFSVRTNASASSSAMGSAARASLFLGCGCCELFRLSMYSSLV
jgi:hypothetical protein